MVNLSTRTEWKPDFFEEGLKGGSFRDRSNMATTPKLISLLVSETGIFIQVSMHESTFSEKVSNFWEEIVQTIVANFGCCLLHFPHVRLKQNQSNKLLQLRCSNLQNQTVRYSIQIFELNNNYWTSVFKQKR